MVQVWPNPDALSYSGTFGAVFGTYLGGYLGVDADASTAWDTGKIMVRTADLDSPDAMCIASSAYEGRRFGFVRREEIAESGGTSLLRADATCYVRSRNHPPEKVLAGPVLKGGCGAIGRLIGGTLTEPAPGVYDPVVYLAQPSFYAAYVVGNGNQVDVILERWNAGTRTQLASRTLTPIKPSFLVPFVVRLECLNAASTVTCTVSLKNVAALEGLFGMATGARLSDVPTWATLNLTNQFTVALTYVDSSGSRLASPGRAGFIIDKENRTTIAGLSGNVDTEAHCRVFDAGATSGTQIRDEWRRSIRAGRDETSRWGDAGSNAGCDWGFDRFSESFRDAGSTPYTGGVTYIPANGYAGFPVARMTTGSAGVDFTVPISKPAQEQLLVMGRELPAIGRAREKITFRHAVAGAGEAGFQIGTVLRLAATGPSGSDGTYLDGFSGYVFAIDGNGRCSVRRRQYAQNVLDTNPLNDTIELATLTIAHSAVSRTLEAECIDDNTSDPPGTAPVLLKMWIDGTQVPFTATLQAGVTVDGVGTLRDASFQRLAGSSGVGMLIATPATDGVTTHRVEVLAVESIEPTGYSAPDDELANVSLRSEASNAVGTLSWTPSVVLPCAVSRERTVADFVTGNRALRPATTVERHRWDVSGLAVLDATLLTLEAFYDAHGIEVPFTWTIPGRAAAKYVFTGELELVETGQGLWDVKFQVEEVHDA